MHTRAYVWLSHSTMRAGWWIAGVVRTAQTGQAVFKWATEQGAARQWGIEGAWNYGRGLAQCLLAGGETVYEINPRWTAAGRRNARNRAKSDPLDTQAVAMLVWREADALPPVGAEDETVLLDLLATDRQ